MKIIYLSVVKVSTVLIVAATLLGVSTLQANAANTPGGKCAKSGLTAKSGKTTLKCTKVGTKLVWVAQRSSGSSSGSSGSGSSGTQPTSSTTSSPKVETTGCGANSAGLFTASPFKVGDISMITNGNETNDARFAYVWVKAPYAKIPLYAPADGVLTVIRHLTSNKVFPSDDFQVQFNLTSTCNDYWRFNHFTDPRADIRAAYSYGDKCSSCFDDNGNPTARYEEYEKPGTAIKVKAGELIGYTSGTPFAHDFDFAIQISDKTVCPMSVLAEPHKSTLLAMLGPGPRSANPSSVPQPGYACVGYGARG
jgi:hypothetical protein